MRNVRVQHAAARFGIACLIVTALGGAGCADQNAKSNEPGVDLNSGYSALARGDYGTARSVADSYLSARPHGLGSAEAYYLRGRALEQQPASSPAERTANLQQARSNFMAALQESPSTDLEGRIHADFGTVAFFQDDLTTALGQYNAAYQQLTDPAMKADCLLRAGLCQQRLNRFAAADNTFEQVQRNFPNTQQADRARQVQGVRTFTVQFGTFAAADAADEAVKQLRGQGLNPSETTDAQGRHLVSVSNVPSFDEARALRDRFASAFPNAIILP